MGFKKLSPLFQLLNFNSTFSLHHVTFNIFPASCDFSGLHPVLTVAPLGPEDDQARGEDHQEVDHDGEEDAGVGGEGDRVEVRPLRSS